MRDPRFTLTRRDFAITIGAAPMLLAGVRGAEARAVQPDSVYERAIVIDALANPDANVLARKVADEKAKDFDCANEPEIVGTFEAWER